MPQCVPDAVDELVVQLHQFNTCHGPQPGMRCIEAIGEQVASSIQQVVVFNTSQEHWINPSLDQLEFDRSMGEDLHSIHSTLTDTDDDRHLREPFIKIDRTGFSTGVV